MFHVHIFGVAATKPCLLLDSYHQSTSRTTFEPMKTSILLFLFTAYQLSSTIYGRSGTSACHPNKNQGTGVTCRKVLLPPELCTSCKLRPFYVGSGKFKDCSAIYDIDDPKCRAQLNRYAWWNSKCDPVRSRQVRDYSNIHNRQGLDFFLYSVCEQCCDCMPVGAQENQYVMRLKQNNLFLYSRGNCPAHILFDVCRIWPRVKFVSVPGMQDQYHLPEICPILRTFVNQQRQGFIQRTNVHLSSLAVNFIDRYMRSAQCGDREIWKTCVRLERAQKKLF